MWEDFEDLTSCPALAGRPDSLLLFFVRRGLPSRQSGVGGGRWGGCARTQTDTVWYFPSAPSPRTQFSGPGHVPLLSALCVRSVGLLAMAGGSERGKGLGQGRANFVTAGATVGCKI